MVMTVVWVRALARVRAGTSTAWRTYEGAAAEAARRSHEVSRRPLRHFEVLALQARGHGCRRCRRRGIEAVALRPGGQSVMLTPLMVRRRKRVVEIDGVTRIGQHDRFEPSGRADRGNALDVRHHVAPWRGDRERLPEQQQRERQPAPSLVLRHAASLRSGTECRDPMFPWGQEARAH